MGYARNRAAHLAITHLRQPIQTHYLDPDDPFLP